jgi:hypothetical protein
VFRMAITFTLAFQLLMKNTSELNLMHSYLYVVFSCRSNDCSWPFEIQPTNFQVYLRLYSPCKQIIRIYFKNNLVGVSFPLLNFHNFNNTFILDNAIGKCTNNQMYTDYRDLSDPTLYSYCVCCGDYNPDPALNCPVNPWS